MGRKTQEELEHEGNVTDFENQRRLRLANRRKGALPFETVRELRARASEMAVPEIVCGPFQTGTWGIIAGGPGTGKSMFVMGLAEAITLGRKFGDWTVPKARSMVIIDAEMTPHELARRIPMCIPDERLLICTLDLLERNGEPPFSLGNIADQTALKDGSAGYDVVVVDNIEYTLEPKEGRDIWHPETWGQVEPLTRWAKAANKLLILIDHTNKDGHVQGSLAKQRGASFVMTLEPQFVEQSALAFSSSFSKMRYQIDESLKRKRVWWLDEFGDWHCEPEESKKNQIIDLMRQGISRKDIIAETGASRSFVYKICRQNKRLLPRKGGDK